MTLMSRAGDRVPRGGWWPALVGGLAGCFALVLVGSIAGGFLLRLVERWDGSTRVDSWITDRLVAHRTDAVTSLANGVSRLGSTSVLLPVVAVVAGLLVWRRRVVLAGLLVVAWAGSIG